PTAPPHLGLLLTDLYPQPAAWADVERRTAGAIQGHAAPVDALHVPANLPGFRVIFSAFHHFAPPQAEALLRDAVARGAGIGVFEGAGKSWLEIGLALTVLPVAQLLLTPFFRPFRWSRLIFTYLVPLIPLTTIWDGVVSIFRMYPPTQLLALARRADPTGRYHALRVPFGWGRVAAVFGILHLLVYPASNGYNSFYDKDEGSIGGLKAPPKVTPELLHLVWLFDFLALGCSLLLGWPFAGLVLVYLLVSKAYSYEGIRLKKYPLVSTAVVV
nr:hypothetical protein [Tanacetum cinerariifolium]